MTADAPRPSDQSRANPARSTEPPATTGTRQSADRPATPPVSTSGTDHGLFRKRSDAIGPAPVYFSVALGVFFGTSVGFLVGQPIIGVVFGALLGALYGMMRRANPRK